ncbi:MAG: hypothetical protein HPY50_22315 [Firmicutes bacterium]|nr:hypothetical protein [Bacillota bacterium]
MTRKAYTPRQRYPKAKLTSINVNYIHPRSPWTAAWWSMAIPGFGHVMLGRYFTGSLLIIWEFLINLKGHVNLGILYTFLGRFDQAREAVDPRWLLFYCGVFVFAVWDSYRCAVDFKNLSFLGDHDGYYTSEPLVIGLAINYLDKRTPWVGAVSSLFMPGLGHLYAGKLVMGVYILTFWTAISYFSHLLEGLVYTFTGGFSQALTVVDPEWLLFLPSIYGFVIYDAYSSVIEHNKLFKEEQSWFFKENYQDPGFDMPF